MSIREGWCVEAVCDRCHVTMYMPYSTKGSSAKQLTRKGWRVEGERAICPLCRRIQDNRQAAETEARQTETRKRKRRMRRRQPWQR